MVSSSRSVSYAAHAYLRGAVSLVYRLRFNPSSLDARHRLILRACIDERWGSPYVWSPNFPAVVMETEHSTPARPQPADVGRAVADALVTGGSTEDLERLVRTYVRALKRADVPPEQALKRVKETVGVPTVTPLPVRGSLPSDQLGDQVVAWFVAEYYRAD